MTDFCVALTTTNSSKEASKIAESLVDERLAACVNVISGVESIYFWEGKRCHEKEWLLVVKLRANRVPELKRRLPQLHSYSSPELIVLQITDGLSEYLSWLRANS
ncbi:MAG: divalent-cation tolerance protein CutA [Deltaproteobacteria bacterium]|nr:divalent-cation tolerance protein CutA [Deltaproteobacteria bacterium]